MCVGADSGNSVLGDDSQLEIYDFSIDKREIVKCNKVYEPGSRLILKINEKLESIDFHQKCLVQKELKCKNTYYRHLNYTLRYCVPVEMRSRV